MSSYCRAARSAFGDGLRLRRFAARVDVLAHVAWHVGRYVCRTGASGTERREKGVASESGDLGSLRLATLAVAPRLARAACARRRSPTPFSARVGVACGVSSHLAKSQLHRPGRVKVSLWRVVWASVSDCHSTVAPSGPLAVSNVVYRVGHAPHTLAHKSPSPPPTSRVSHLWALLGALSISCLVLLEPPTERRALYTRWDPP